MNKQHLLRFIQKYSLGGVIESVAWNAEGNKLSVRFISDDKTMLGEVDFNGFTSKPFNRPPILPTLKQEIAMLL